jgi:uncharacterized membrane protein
MYFLDPRLGRRRRTMVQDQLRRLSRQASEGLDMGLRDLKNRGQGLVHDAEALMHMGQYADGTISTRGRFKWSPGPRLVAATGGTALMANCAVCRTTSSMLLGALGLGLVAKALGGKADVHIERTTEIHAPIDQVFEFFANPENYLRISDAITNVELMDGGRFAKSIAMAGVPVRFEERFTCCDKNRRIETRSEPSSPIKYSKQMSFEQVGEHHTRMHLHFCYSPPGGELGHAVASFMGLDAQSLLCDLLMRAKNFLETGREPHDATARRHASNGHNGSAKRKRQTPQGSGAPVSDVQRLAIREEPVSPWPMSARSGLAPRVGVASPYPPAID